MRNEYVFSHGKTIYLITTNMSAGGAERQEAGLACALKNLGYNVRVRFLRRDGENSHYFRYLEKNSGDICVPRMPDFSDIKLMKQQGVDISLIKYLPRQLRIDAISLAAEFIRNPVDMVHCYLDWSCCYGGFAAMLSGVLMIQLFWVVSRHFI